MKETSQAREAAVGAIKEFATELDLYWTHHDTAFTDAWTRILPDGESAGITTDINGAAFLTVDQNEIGEYPSVIEALLAVGRIARAQLAQRQEMWAA